jgi:hypothetical protein
VTRSQWSRAQPIDDMSQPHLSLVWDRDRALANKSGKKRQGQPAQTAVSEKPTGQVLTWLNDNQGVLTILGLIGAAFFFVGSWYASWYMRSGLESELRAHVDETISKALEPIVNDIEGIVNDIKGIRNDVQQLKIDLVSVRDRVGSLERVFYKEKAESLGLQDPRVVPVHVSQPQAISQSDGEIPYTLNLTLGEVTQNHLRFSVNGTIGTVTFRDVLIRVPFQIGVPINLGDVLEQFGVHDTPALWMVIFALPTPDTAIVATGSKAPVNS